MFYYAVRIECRETHEIWYFGRWYATKYHNFKNTGEIPTYLLKKVNTILDGTNYTYEIRLYAVSREEFKRTYDESYRMLYSAMDDYDIYWIARYITSKDEMLLNCN